MTRNFGLWVYAATLAAALFWQGPDAVARAPGSTLLLWGLWTVAGAVFAVVIAWTLDPHGTLPRWLGAAAFGWGTASGLLVFQTDHQLRELLIKRLGVEHGELAARWLGFPLTHHALVLLGVALLLAVARNRVLRPTDGMKLGLYSGLGLWSGCLLTVTATGAWNDPAGELPGALVAGLPHWCALAAAPWAAGAIGGYGFGAAICLTSWARLKRAAVLTGCLVVSAAVACFTDGIVAEAVDAVAGGWSLSWAWAALAAVGLTLLIVLTPRSTGWWAACGAGALGYAFLFATSTPWPLIVIAASTPLAVQGLKQTATRTEGVWLATALSDEADEVREGCAEPADVVDPSRRKARAAAALAAYGPKARPFGIRLRSGQIRLGTGKELLVAERRAAGDKPNAEWRAWLEHIAADIEAERAGIRRVFRDMTREDGVYQ